MINWNLIIFLIKLVIVVLTLLSPLFIRVDASTSSAFVVSHTSSKVALLSARASILGRSLSLSRIATPGGDQSIRMGLSSTTTTAPSTTKEYTPSQVVVDETTGERWRLCAGVAVLNSRNELLMAERLDRPGNWQCPQGGVDDIHVDGDEGSGGGKTKETIVDAAIRELFEETGLVAGRHVLLDPTFPIPSNDGGTGVRYSTSTSKGNNWLTQAGFAGQELHWTVFRCMNGRGDLDPSDMCDLSGQDGSTAEFSRVAWMDINTAVQGVWEGKRAPYRLLESLIERHGEKWAAQIGLLDFSGTWERDLLQSTNVVSALEARGLKPDESLHEAQKPYIQDWTKDPDDPSSWIVTTFEVDGKTPRRKLEYKPGSWTETYVGRATLFGESLEPVSLNRQTRFVAEADGVPIPIAQVTITYGPKGIEESRRYLKDGKLILRRTFWSVTGPTVPVVSTEVFIMRS